MPKLEIVSIPIGVEQRRLKIYRNGSYIGEYERSLAKDIGKKSREIACASDFLTEVYECMGEFVVQWDPEAKRKSVQVNGAEIGEIPRRFWRESHDV